MPVCATEITQWLDDLYLGFSPKILNVLFKSMK